MTLLPEYLPLLKFIDRGTLLDNRGQVALPRARLIALEVVKAICNKDGSIPGVADLTMNSLTARICDAKDTKLRRDR